MGNCQASDLDVAIVECPTGRVARLSNVHDISTAQCLMSDYPNHFVTLVNISHTPSFMNTPPYITNHLWNSFPKPHVVPPPIQLLPPDAPLRNGHRYRLVSFEEVLTHFSQGGASSNIVNVSADRLPTKVVHLQSSKLVTMTNHVVKIGC